MEEGCGSKVMTVPGGAVENTRAHSSASVISRRRGGEWKVRWCESRSRGMVVMGIVDGEAAGVGSRVGLGLVVVANRGRERGREFRPRRGSKGSKMEVKNSK